MAAGTASASEGMIMMSNIHAVRARFVELFSSLENTSTYQLLVSSLTLRSLNNLRYKAKGGILDSRVCRASSDKLGSPLIVICIAYHRRYVEMSNPLAFIRRYWNNLYILLLALCDIYLPTTLLLNKNSIICTANDNKHVIWTFWKHGESNWVTTDTKLWLAQFQKCTLQ